MRRSDGAGRGMYQRMRRRFLDNCRAQRASCFFCGNELDFTARHGDPRAVTVHHVIPVVTAPHLEFDTGNWKPACALCNKLGMAAFGPDDSDDRGVVPDTGVESEDWNTTLLNEQP